MVYLFGLFSQQCTRGVSQEQWKSRSALLESPELLILRHALPTALRSLSQHLQVPPDGGHGRTALRVFRLQLWWVCNGMLNISAKNSCLSRVGVFTLRYDFCPKNRKRGILLQRMWLQVCRRRSAETAHASSAQWQAIQVWPLSGCVPLQGQPREPQDCPHRYIQEIRSLPVNCSALCRWYLTNFFSLLHSDFFSFFFFFF